MGVTGCDACGQYESLGHILQLCPKTKYARDSRHNRVFTYIGEGLRKVGYSVLEKPAIPTLAGNRRPDLVVSRGNAAAVIDITIVADNAQLDVVHDRKVTYYSVPEIIDCVRMKYDCQNVCVYGAAWN